MPALRLPLWHPRARHAIGHLTAKPEPGNQASPGLSSSTETQPEPGTQITPCRQQARDIPQQPGCELLHTADSLLLDALDPYRRVACLSAGSVARTAPHLRRGRVVLVTERDQVPVRHGRRGGALSEPVPRTPGDARRPFLLGIGAGLAVRIAVIALADHAGSRVIGMWGSATEHDFSVSDEPGHPVGLYTRRCVRSQKEP